MRVFVTGGTGLIGRRLVRRLAARGDPVVVLTRDRPRAEAALAGLAEPALTIVKGDPASTGIWRESVAGCDAVVNLAGEPIFGRRWNDAVKEKIRSSRVEGTRNVVGAIGLAPAGRRPPVLVNASAIGYYGTGQPPAVRSEPVPIPGSRGSSGSREAAAAEADRRLTEHSHPGTDFLAQVCVAWEDAARAATAHGTRVVVVRTGVVLAPEGGALAQMVPAFKLYLGGPAGDGEQWFSWVHVDDVVGLILHALDVAAVRGPVNATGPEPVRMKDFARDLGRILGRPSWFKVPRFALRLRFGEVADVILASARVTPVAAEAAGYLFKFATARAALEDCLMESVRK